MKITFSTKEHLLGAIPSPVKANKLLPAYFKAIKPQHSDHPSASTIKRCIPFLEASSAGYIIPLWADLYVTAENGELTFEFPQGLAMESSMSTHSHAQIKGHPLENNPYGDMPWKFHSPWVIETDDNVSCIFTSPLNHLETRIKILDGVVDTDNYYNSINFPFLWTGGDGKFLIKQGTPLVQVIPFIRTDYELVVCENDEERITNTKAALSAVMSGAYKNKFYHRRKSSEEE